MFDISFGELLLVGAVALVVLGPERLPKVARTAGILFGRAQRFVHSVKADLQQQVAQTELAQIEAELRAEGRELRQSLDVLPAALDPTDRLPPLQSPESLGIAPLPAGQSPAPASQADDGARASTSPTPAAMPAAAPDSAAAPQPRRQPRKLTEVSEPEAAPEPVAAAAPPQPAAPAPQDAQLDLFADYPDEVSGQSQDTKRDRR
ncbi:Sec-independent protein translocase protein TatB [Chitinilyticum litopenaei]|uniref:Sec-independent protein translocase protein TatB n=1 Tax=Chitinilyticum litopenaei TaxID=1121276 RepID=UPI000400F60B|nr:Sec-independent protein translocase protein TatB [Chitinilyticum litopenaei]